MIMTMMMTMTPLPRFSADTLAYCGANTVCTNSLGSFSCPCAGGYEGFVANQGCSDINECTHSSWNYYVGSVQSHLTQNYVVFIHNLSVV